MNEGLQVTELIAGLPKYSTSLFTAGISRFPTTAGQHVIVLHSPYLFALDRADLLEVLNFARTFANEIKTETKIKRCGLGYDGHQCLQIIPMHGLGEDWTPILAPEAEMDQTYPGYLSTKSGPAVDKDMLDVVQRRIANSSGWNKPDHTFHGDQSDDNLFARLIRGEIPQWRVWEDDDHLAFLTPFPNTPGYTVLIPRQHLPSDIFGLREDAFNALMDASARVVEYVQVGLGVDRVGMFFEGFEIDYAHVKFVPVHSNEAPEGPSDEYHDTYPGYLTTRLGPEQSYSRTIETSKLSRDQRHYISGSST